MVRDYHVYRDVWEAAVGQTLPCQREAGNPHDPYAISVTEGGTIVGHVPRAISAVCSLFLRRNGTILCEVTGTRRKSSTAITFFTASLAAVMVDAGTTVASELSGFGSTELGFLK